MVLRLRGGCIAAPIPAVFVANSDAPGSSFLRLTPQEIVQLHPSEALDIARQLGSKCSRLPEWSCDEIVLDLTSCTVLMRLLDKLAVESVDSKEDLRIPLTVDELRSYIGQNALDRLETKFDMPYDSIRLRRVEANGKVCIVYRYIYLFAYIIIIVISIIMLLLLMFNCLK
jgi:hypothetical protein